MAKASVTVPAVVSVEAAKSIDAAKPAAAVAVAPAAAAAAPAAKLHKKLVNIADRKSAKRFRNTTHLKNKLHKH